MAIVWERRGEAYHALVAGRLDEVQFYMTVATLPNGRWEWLVWLPRSDSFVSDGDVLTVQEAMRDAELFVACEVAVRC
jgi:hypothetical protein